MKYLIYLNVCSIDIVLFSLQIVTTRCTTRGSAGSSVGRRTRGASRASISATGSSTAPTAATRTPASVKVRLLKACSHHDEDPHLCKGTSLNACSRLYEDCRLCKSTSRIAQLVERSLTNTQVVLSRPASSHQLVMVSGVTELAASWLSERSASVAPEVDLREHTISLPLQCG